jgi:hypothetical protein
MGGEEMNDVELKSHISSSLKAKAKEIVTNAEQNPMIADIKMKALIVEALANILFWLPEE